MRLLPATNCDKMLPGFVLIAELLLCHMLFQHFYCFRLLCGKSQKAFVCQTSLIQPVLLRCEKRGVQYVRHMDQQDQLLMYRIAFTRFQRINMKVEHDCPPVAALQYIRKKGLVDRFCRLSCALLRSCFRKRRQFAAEAIVLIDFSEICADLINITHMQACMVLVAVSHNVTSFRFVLPPGRENQVTICISLSKLSTTS